MLFFLSLFALCPLALADARSEAEAAMQEGAALYKKKSFTEAIDAYRKALFAFPEAPGPYREIAKCHMALKQSAEAIDNFTEYLNRRPDAPEREEIEELLPTLRAQLPKKGKALLSVETDPPGSMVYVIDKNGLEQGIGVAPIQEHPVDPGVVKVRAERAYFEPEEQSVSLKANTPAQVKVVLSTARKAPTSVVVVPAGEEPAKGYLFLGASAASAAGAATFGVLFLGARADFALVTADDPEVEAKQKQQQLLANVSDGLTGVAVVTGGIGAYLFFKHRKYTKENEKKTAVVPAQNGVALVGQF